jgi:hypothetical protein
LIFIVPEVPDVNTSEFKGLDHPLILGIPITVFVSPQGVRDALDGIDDWTCEIIRGVDFPFITAKINVQRKQWSMLIDYIPGAMMG